MGSDNATSERERNINGRGTIPLPSGEASSHQPGEMDCSPPTPPILATSASDTSKLA